MLKIFIFIIINLSFHICQCQCDLNDIVDLMCGNHDHLPIFNPYIYNDPIYKSTNNCYSFAIMDRLPKNLRDHKLQPGEEAHLPNINTRSYGCSLFRHYVLKDHPTYFFRDGRDNAPCPCGYFKAALYITDNNDINIDYHWYRQGNKHWYHKPGSSSVETLDARGDMIYDPEVADRDYSFKNGPNYSISCGYLCVEANMNEMDINNDLNDPDLQYSYVPSSI